MGSIIEGGTVEKVWTVINKEYIDLQKDFGRI